MIYIMVYTLRTYMSVYTFALISLSCMYECMYVCMYVQVFRGGIFIIINKRSRRLNLCTHMSKCLSVVMKLYRDLKIERRQVSRLESRVSEFCCYLYASFVMYVCIIMYIQVFRGGIIKRSRRLNLRTHMIKMFVSCYKVIQQQYPGKHDKTGIRVRCY